MRRTLNVSFQSETRNLSINMVKEDSDNGMQKIVIQSMDGRDGAVKERLQWRNEEPRYSISGFRFNGIQIEEQKENVVDFIKQCYLKLTLILTDASMSAIKVKYSVDDEVQEFPCDDSVLHLSTFLKEIRTLMLNDNQIYSFLLCTEMNAIIIRLNEINFRKRRDSIILGVVIGLCLVFIIWYAFE